MVTVALLCLTVIILGLVAMFSQTLPGLHQQHDPGACAGIQRIAPPWTSSRVRDGANVCSLFGDFDRHDPRISTRTRPRILTASHNSSGFADRPEICAPTISSRKPSYLTRDSQTWNIVGYKGVFPPCRTGPGSGAGQPLSFRMTLSPLRNAPPDTLSPLSNRIVADHRGLRGFRLPGLVAVTNHALG